MAWNGSGLQVDCAEAEASGSVLKIPDDIYRKGCVANLQEGLEASERIGYPVMIKASEGGGGKGIRMVSLRRIGKAPRKRTTNDLLLIIDGAFSSVGAQVRGFCRPVYAGRLRGSRLACFYHEVGNRRPPPGGPTVG